MINPIIAAIFGERQNFESIGFDIGDPPPPGRARRRQGRVDRLIINAVISFIVVAFFLFLVVKAYNNMKERMARENPEAPDAPGADIVLLTEIRDELRANRER